MAEAGLAAKRAVNDFAMIAVKALELPDRNVRKHVDQEQLKELAASIREKGLIEPIVVRSLSPVGGGNDGSGFEVVAGSRRYRAAKLAGLAEVPCIVRELSDEQALEIQVIENVQRVDVTPLEEAEGFQRLMDVGTYDVKALAVKLGKSIEYVYARLKLQKLSERAKESLAGGKISAAHGVLLAALDEVEQGKVLRDAGSEPSVRRLADTIRWHNEDKKRQAEWAKQEEARKKREAEAAARGEKPEAAQSANRKPAAQLAKERKTEAIEATRTIALGLVAQKQKAPLKFELLQLVAQSLFARHHFDSQKLICKALGIWPRDGKIAGFDFRGRGAAFVAAQKPQALPGVLLALALAPSWGNWKGSYGNTAEAKTLTRVAAILGIKLPAMERKAVAEALSKGKRKPAKKVKK